MQSFFAKFGHFVILGLLSLATMYATGGRIDWEDMPALEPRVLSMFTQVPEGFVLVVDVADGDTIVVDMDGKEETVRLLGVDTPETRDPRRPVQCFGKEASDFTKKLLTGKPVHLLKDPDDDERDQFGRLLRYVYLEDGTMVNERLVYEGYAFAYEKYPTGRTQVLKQMEDEARLAKRGLWGGCETTIKNNGKSKSTQAVE